MIPGKILIIGLGNPILGDDGVGWRVAEEVRAALQTGTGSTELTDTQPNTVAQVEVDCLSVGGLALMERIIGYERVILIDAISTGAAAPGQISCFPLEKLANLPIGHINSAHDTTLVNALQVGRSMGASLPKRIAVVAIEAQNLYEFSEQLSQPVAAAVKKAAEAVLQMLQNQRLESEFSYN